MFIKVVIFILYLVSVCLCPNFCLASLVSLYLLSRRKTAGSILKSKVVCLFAIEWTNIILNALKLSLVYNLNYTTGFFCVVY